MLARIIIFVAEIDRMTEFYRTGFGLAVRDASDPDFVVLGSEGIELALHRIAVEIVGEGSSDHPREDSYVKHVFRTDDVAGVRERLVAMGAPMREIHRYRDFEFCDGIDPEGNIFQISSR